MKKIVVLGPESVGKSTMCAELQKKLNAVVLPEIARTYIEKLNRHYTYDDIETIANMQITEFKKATANNTDKEFLILDTYLIITKVWFLHVYNRYPKWLQAELKKSKIDLFILLKPDIEWIEDPVRENPHIREYLYNWYKRELDEIKANYVEIGGVGTIRTKRAIRAINKLKKMV